MKVFVFGAGATKGSQGPQVGNLDAEVRAPLVNELFNPNYIELARLAGIHDGDMERFRKAMQAENGGSLEQWLTRKWEAIGSLRQELTKQAERSDFGRLAFYIASVLLGVSRTYSEANGYSTFALKLRAQDEPWAIINFNYDTLLDQALHHHFGRDFSHINEYLAVNYLKPHGSVNWFLDRRQGSGPAFLQYREVVEGLSDIRARIALAAYWMYNGAPLRGDDIIVIRPNHLDLQYSNFGRLFEAFDWRYFYPLVFMPLTTKMYSVVEGFEQLMLGRGTELVSNAAEIFLIGYKANDEILKEMMKSMNRETVLHVIGMGGAEEISNRVCAWSPHLRQGMVYKEGFGKFVMTEMRVEH